MTDELKATFEENFWGAHGKPEEAAARRGVLRRRATVARSGGVCLQRGMVLDIIKHVPVEKLFSF
ncbi:MAG: hypothetical protein ACLUMK_11325 [Christensenellales bacterium]